MKLRRLISALVVFTLVMTCALSVVSVEADETSVPTYHATTTYNPATDEITVHAKITGATSGSVVTFTIYGDNDRSTGDDVDGDDVVHTAEGTVAEDGTLVFEECTYSYTAVENRKIKFTSDMDELTRYNNGAEAATNVCQSVNEITRFNKSILFATKNFFGGKYCISYVKDGVVYESKTLSSALASKTAWAGANNNGRAQYDDPDAAGDDDSCIFVLPLDADYWMIDFRAAKDRSITNTINIYNYSGSFNGKEYSGMTGDTIFDNSGATIVNNLVGNRYKEVVSDGTFAGINLEGGKILALNITNATDKTTGTASRWYMTIYSDPIIGEYTDANGRVWDSLTFLYKVGYDSTKNGIRIYRYPKGTVNYDSAGGTAGAVGELVETNANDQDVFGYPKANVSKGNYGVQLVGDLELDKYDYEAIPCMYSNSTYGGNGWVEITPFGTTGFTYSGRPTYYVNERDAYEEVKGN